MSVLLQTEKLSKHFGGVYATQSVNLTVAAGETHAIIGPNGAGKTTLIAQLAGAIAPDEGKIVFDSVDVTRQPQHRRVAAGLARSFQITNLFPRFSVRDNMLLAVQAASGSSFRFWREREKALQQTAEALLESIGLADCALRPVSALAHGQQRQLELGLALATRPRLLLLDEPMAGMGPEESAQMARLLAKLKAQLTLILIEHDMDTVFSLADRISVLVGGRIIATGAPDEVRENPNVQAAYLGHE